MLVRRQKKGLQVRNIAVYKLSSVCQLFFNESDKNPNQIPSKSNGKDQPTTSFKQSWRKSSKNFLKKKCSLEIFLSELWLCPCMYESHSLARCLNRGAQITTRSRLEGVVLSII